MCGEHARVTDIVLDQFKDFPFIAKATGWILWTEINSCIVFSCSVQDRDFYKAISSLVSWIVSQIEITLVSDTSFFMKFGNEM